MRDCPNPKIEKYRLRDFPTLKGNLGTNSAFGNNGAFRVPAPTGVLLTCLVSDGAGWEHVSVDAGTRIPTWDEMDFIKKCFWEDCEVVVQFHVNGKKKVNVHPYTLHLWKPVGGWGVMPPSILV